LLDRLICEHIVRADIASIEKGRLYQLLVLQRVCALVISEQVGLSPLALGGELAQSPVCIASSEQVEIVYFFRFAFRLQCLQSVA
jgi:glycerate-2-kinase